MFTFKESWSYVLSGLPDEVRLEVYDAIMEYGIRRNCRSLKPMAGKAFEVIKADIDKEFAKKERISKARSEARINGHKKKLMESKENKRNQLISKVGTPSKSTTSDGNHKPQTSNLNPQTGLPSHAHVIGDNKNNNQQDIEKEKLEKKERESKKRKNEKPEVPPENPPKDIVDVKAFIAYFNTELEKAKAVIPHNCSYTEKRDNAIHARVREHGRRSLQVMVQKAAQSDFLNGKNDRTFVAFLDWLLRPNNFVKVIEGNYDNDKVDGLKFKNNSYGNKQQYDRRRGVDAEKHRPEEY